MFCVDMKQVTEHYKVLSESNSINLSRILDMDKLEELQAVSWLDYITLGCPEDCTTCNSLETKERYV